LKRNGCQERLVLFGEYSPEQAKEAITASLGPDLTPTVHLLGSLKDEELGELYARAAVFVFPSLAEGFGIPAVEAMACGTCVVASHTGSLPEVCGEAAVYVNPRDPAGLAATIHMLMEEPERRAVLEEKGRLQARKYDWKDSAAKLARMFETLN